MTSMKSEHYNKLYTAAKALVYAKDPFDAEYFTLRLRDVINGIDNESIVSEDKIVRINYEELRGMFLMNHDVDFAPVDDVLDMLIDNPHSVIPSKYIVKLRHQNDKILQVVYNDTPIATFIVSSLNWKQ